MGLLFKSTRGDSQKVSCSEAILKGIAHDGGLYVPIEFPKIDIHEEGLLDLDYKAFALKILKLYLTDFEEVEIVDCIEKAYDSKFEADEIVPIKHLSDCGFIELYHGSTLAFKDMALSILPHFLKKSAEKQGLKEDVVILAATSGDTGKAALEGFCDVEGTKIIVFYPTKGISEIQKRQMTTQVGNNTYVYGINGNFDDAQRGVKSIFANKVFNEELNEKGFVFSSANSINIGRLLPQVVYYIYAYFNLVKENKIKLGEAFNVVVPTGNFGNILAARYAKEMGLPINKFICASNDNSILTDFISTGIYDTKRDFEITISPSMDILVSSNLERLLYLMSDDNTGLIKTYMDDLKDKGLYEVSDAIKEKLKEFYGNFATETETLDAISQVYKRDGYVMDTHTAVGYSVYNKYKEASKDETYTLIAATASPFKFTRSVVESISKETNYDDCNDFQLVDVLNEIGGLRIPSSIIGLEDREIRHKENIEKNEMEAIIRKSLR